MKRKGTRKIARLMALALVAVLALTSANVTTASAATETQHAQPEGEKYDDINTLGATVTVSKTILKVKKNNAAQTPKPSKVVVNGVTLKLNKGYTLSYQKWNNIQSYWYEVDNLTNAGTYRMVITGIGDYSGVTTKRVYVYGSDVSVPASSIKVSVNKMDYTGSPITEGVIKSVKYKNKVLTEGEDYTVTYLNNVDSGTGIVRITGTGRTWYDSNTGKVDSKGFVGEKEVKFTIKGGTKLSKAKVTGLTAMTYDAGNSVTQDMSQVKITYKNTELKLGTDYVVSYYMNNKKAGTAKIVFTGKGLYYGTVTKTFKINKAVLNENMLDKASKNIVMEYTKKAVKPEVTLYDSYGNPLVKGTDYTLAYKNNTKVSDKAVIIIKGKGNYSGTLNVNFTITDKDVVDEPGKDDKPDTDDATDESQNPEVPDDTETPETEESQDEDSKDEDSKDDESKDEESKNEESKGTTDGEDSKDEETEDDESKDATDGTDSETEESENEGEESESTEPVGYRYCTVCLYRAYFYSMEGPSDEEQVVLDKHESWYHNGKSPSYEDRYEDVNGDDPIAVRICITCCQKEQPYGMLVYTYGLSDEEKAAWRAHSNEHTANNETCSYTAWTYEQWLQSQ